MRTEPGEVLLVGAGPGSVDLMTVRAVRVVKGAQALLYDALVPDEILALAPDACLRIKTGKRAGKASMKQATINRLMLGLARRGLRVVRLKGGDPSVFGRSGEERAYLEERGIVVEIVPGVTAASAAAAQFAFPLTHRGEARRVVFATVRIADGAVVEGGWSSLADPETTVALYMARDTARVAAERLVAAGRAPNTPVLAVENAGRREARLIKTRLEDLAEALDEAAPQGPVVLLVGAVAAHARDGRVARSPSAVAKSARELMFRNASVAV